MFNDINKPMNIIANKGLMIYLVKCIMKLNIITSRIIIKANFTLSEISEKRFIIFFFPFLVTVFVFLFGILILPSL